MGHGRGHSAVVLRRRPCIGLRGEIGRWRLYCVVVVPGPSSGLLADGGERCWGRLQRRGRLEVRSVKPCPVPGRHVLLRLPGQMFRRDGKTERAIIVADRWVHGCLEAPRPPIDATKAL